MSRGESFPTLQRARNAAKKRGYEDFDIKEFNGKFYLFEVFSREDASRSAQAGKARNVASLAALADSLVEEDPEADPVTGVGHRSAGHARHVAAMHGWRNEQYDLRRDDNMLWWVRPKEGEAPGQPPKQEGPHKQELEEDRKFKATVPNTLLARNHSTVEKPVARVHRICAEMAGKPRKEVIARCVEEGVNIHTAKTQYQVWSRNQRQAAVLEQNREG